MAATGARYVALGLSVPAQLPSPSGSLDAIVQRAGGVHARHHGHTVVTNYGSAPGELAACVSAVGLADWSQLTKLLIAGPPAAMRELTLRMTGAELAPGGAVDAGGAWWCAESAERALVLGEPHAEPQLRVGLARASSGRDVWVTDQTDGWATLAVVGRRTRELLAGVGVYGPSGDPRAVTPVRRHRCDGVWATWLLQADDTAWAVLPRPDAPALWRALDHAGRRLSLCAVGQDAVARYRLIRRCSGRH